MRIKIALFIIILFLGVPLSGCRHNNISPIEQELLSLSSSSTPEKAIAIIDSLNHTPLSNQHQYRLSAIRTYSRFRSGYDDTISEGLDSCVIAELRKGGKEELPFLVRGLFGYGKTEYNAKRYQSALNLLTESADKALYEANDTFLASRAQRALAQLYLTIKDYSRSSQAYLKSYLLHQAIGDTLGADLMILGHSRALADMGVSDRSLEILDSIRYRHQNNPDYLNYLYITNYYIVPCLISKDYAGVIQYGTLSLQSPECALEDSIYIYGQMTRALIRLQDYAKAKLYLDTLLGYRHQNFMGYGRRYVGINRILMEFKDSTKMPISSSREYSEALLEFDTLYNLVQNRIVNLEPTYPKGEAKATEGWLEYTILSGSILLICLIAFLFYRKRNKKEYQYLQSTEYIELCARTITSANSKLSRLISLYDKDSKDRNPPLIAELKAIINHMQTTEFDKDLSTTTTIIEPKISSHIREIDEKLSPLDKKILFMTISGYPLTVLQNLLRISRATTYRYRDKLVSTLDNSNIEYFKRLRNKYFKKNIKKS